MSQSLPRAGGAGGVRLADCPATRRLPSKNKVALMVPYFRERMRFEHLATGATTTLRGRIITTALHATSGNYSAAHRLPCLHAFPDLPPRGIDEASCAREDNHEEPLAMAAGANALGLPFLQEACVLSLLLVLLVLWLVLVIALAAWTIWFSGYLYSEPTGEIYWRAPAAGAAVLF